MPSPAVRPSAVAAPAATAAGLLATPASVMPQAPALDAASAQGPPQSSAAEAKPEAALESDSSYWSGKFDQAGAQAPSEAIPAEPVLAGSARALAHLSASKRNWYYESIRNDAKSVEDLQGRLDRLSADLGGSLDEAVARSLAGMATRGVRIKSVYAHGSQVWGKKAVGNSRDTDVLVVVDGEARQADGTWSRDVFSYKPGVKTSDGRDFDLLVVSNELLQRFLKGQVQESLGMPLVQWHLFRGDGVLMGGHDVLGGEVSPVDVLNDVGRMLWNAGKKMELFIFGSEQRGLSPGQNRKVEGTEKIPAKLLSWMLEVNLILDRLEPLYGVESKPLPVIGRASDFWPRYFQSRDPQTLFKEPLDSVVIQLDQATSRRFDRLRDTLRRRGKPESSLRSRWERLKKLIFRRVPAAGIAHARDLIGARRSPFARLTSRKLAAVLFDWDNTLVDERGTVEAVRMQLFQELGVPTPPFEEANRTWRTDRDGFYGRYFPGISRDTVNQTYYAIMERVRLEREKSGQPFNPLLPGVRETLAELKRQGVPMAIVSNKPHEQLMRELKALGLEGYFVYAQGHAEGRQLKPSPQPVLEAMRRLGVAGQDVWYVGDELVDMAAARGAGAQGIYFGTQNAEVVRQGAAGEVAQVDDQRQFLGQVLQKLPQGKNH